MVQQVLEIHWSYGTEFVPLHDLTSLSQNIRTSERWNTVAGRPFVSYIASVEEYSRRGKKNILRLRYSKDEQSDKRVIDPENEVRWGLSVIKWNSSGPTGTAEWIDAADDGPLYNGTVKVTVLGGQNPVNTLRESATVIVKLRPKQQELRDALLCLDQRCALTAENEATALDAAHIVPVKNGGHENIDNAILLRADLHRLFDAGLFWFHVSAKGGVLRHSDLLSDRYAKILMGTKLPDPTFERVARALRLRAKLPDGNGSRPANGT